MNNQSDLLKEKDRLVREYQEAIKAGVHNRNLYNKIMEINNRIMRDNDWTIHDKKVETHENHAFSYLF